MKCQPILWRYPSPSLAELRAFICGGNHPERIELASPMELTCSQLHGDAAWVGSTSRSSVLGEIGVPKVFILERVHHWKGFMS